MLSSVCTKGERMNFLILTCGTGEGHNSAAYAVLNELNERGHGAEVRDVLSFRSERARKRVTGGYSAMIRRTPRLFGLIYRLGDLYDRSGLPSPIYAFNASYGEAVARYIRERAIGCVICTHLFAMETMTAVRRELGVPAYGVLTDYTDIPFYKDTSLDGYFAPTPAVKEELVRRGLDSRKIFVTGIPVHAKFTAAMTKAEARGELGIPAGEKVAAVLTGGAGCGKIVKLCRHLSRLNGVTAYVFTGRNEKLRRRIGRKFPEEHIRAVPFTPDVDVYLKAADVALSKAGGLSSTEIAVCNVPLVHLRSIPGVESANVKFFTENRLSVHARTMRRAADWTERLLSDGTLAEEMAAAQRKTINANAARDLVDTVLEDMIYDGFLVDAVHSRGISLGERDVQQDPAQAHLA